MSKNQPNRSAPATPQAADDNRASPTEEHGLAAAFGAGAGRAMDDEDFVRRNPSEMRGERGVTDAEDPRSEFDGMSDAEFEDLVRNQFEQTALPTPPAIPGWHLCWLTTRSRYDSIQKRQRLGYRPVRLEELKGFDPANGQSVVQGYEGFVTCNEMVLHKIPEVRYQQMMRYFHHQRPLEDMQTTLKKIQDGLEAEQDSTGRDLGEVLGDGYLDMEKSAKRDRGPAPAFR